MNVTFRSGIEQNVTYFILMQNRGSLKIRSLKSGHNAKLQRNRKQIEKKKCSPCVFPPKQGEKCKCALKSIHRDLHILLETDVNATNKEKRIKNKIHF